MALADDLTKNRKLINVNTRNHIKQSSKKDDINNNYNNTEHIDILGRILVYKLQQQSINTHNSASSNIKAKHPDNNAITQNFYNQNIILLPSSPSPGGQGLLPQNLYGGATFS